MAAPASTVQVYVCDYNGIAQLVEVPIGTTLKELVRAAFHDPSFTTGAFLGFEDKNLAQGQLVTAADATRWTAEKPLKLKYKGRFVSDLVNDVESESEAKNLKFTLTNFRRKGVNAIQVSGDDRNKSVPLTQLLNGQRLAYTTPEPLLMNAEMKTWMQAAANELLYSHFGFHPDSSRCSKNCNCGVEILEVEPTSEEEMASMRGIGPVKAERYFNLFRFG
ncbi:hypothetical protein DVH05_002797 [Phytophthora capsici]|nr:hypothetical protein DVH05_002797 [Phytophthora capsici]